MKLMIVGASRGLGLGLIRALPVDGDSVIGVSRTRPESPGLPEGVDVRWIEADFSRPLEAVEKIMDQAPEELDAVIYNLGVWEEGGFTQQYSFLEQADESILEMVSINITGAIVLMKRLIPRLLSSPKPQVILTGGTSGLRRSGRPEVTFGASKFALTGIADALRESFRSRRLAVTCLQLGYLDTDDLDAVTGEQAVSQGGGWRIPVQDVVQVVRTILTLSNASFVREIVMPAIRDERF